MLQIDGNKMTQDYSELCKKRAYHMAIVEQAAKTFASSRGYDETKTAQFVECVKNFETDGLSAEEHAKLAMLESYISEMADNAVNAG